MANVNSIIGPALVGKVFYETIYSLKNSWLSVACDTHVSLLLFLLLLPIQDPTEQTQIDDFMVQQLDGTVNEWGWCKQKVCHSFKYYSSDYGFL